MKAIAKRLRRLEDQFRPADGKPRERFRIVLQPAGLRTPDLAHSTVPKDSVAERHRSRDRGSGTSSNGREITDDELDKWVASVPIAAVPRAKAPAVNGH